MKIYKITTRDVKPHTSKLRFHITINDKLYEYVTQAINKTTINIMCASFKTKDHNSCRARATLIPGDHLKRTRNLKRTRKECKSKSKFKWADTNIQTDYFDIGAYTFKDHSCIEMCLKGCVLKHTCPVSKDETRNAAKADVIINQGLLLL